MNNFVFHNPTKILFGKDTTRQIGAETLNYGKKVLLVSGQRSVKENPILDQASSSLKEAGCELVQFTGVSPNPLLSHVRQGISLCKEQKCDVICAVGGGSVIDSAKAIAAGSVVDHDVWKFFTTKKSIKATTPLTCISTLAASGSDNNSGMVLTHDEKKLKFGYGSKFLYPKVSILDPESTYSVAPDQTAFGAVDIISHLLEFYLTTNLSSTPIQDRIMEGLICSVMESCENALINGRDYLARAELMWSASLALSGLPSSGLGRVSFPMHLIEHSLSALYNVAHGAGLAVVIPAWMSFQIQNDPARIARLGEGVFKIDGKNEQDKALQTISELKQWFVKIKCPVTLAELGIKPDTITAIAENTQPLAKIWRSREYDIETTQEILLLCQ